MQNNSVKSTTGLRKYQSVLFFGVLSIVLYSLLYLC